MKHRLVDKAVLCSNKNVQVQDLLLAEFLVSYKQDINFDIPIQERDYKPPVAATGVCSQL